MTSPQIPNRRRISNIDFVLEVNYEATGKCFVFLAAAVAGETAFGEAFGSLLLELPIADDDFAPGQTLLLELLHGGVWIELFYVPYAA